MKIYRIYYKDRFVLGDILAERMIATNEGIELRKGGTISSSVIAYIPKDYLVIEIACIDQ